MKKVRIIFVAAILAALAAIPMFAAAAALTPEFDESATEKLYEYMDFDKVKNEGEWKSPARIIDDGSGNMVYDVRDAYDYFGQNSLKNHRNYTIEYNAKITYNGDAPGIIFKEHTTNDQLRMQLILDAGNGKITLKELEKRFGRR